MRYLKFSCNHIGYKKKKVVWSSTQFSSMRLGIWDNASAIE
jgi:hypothetical protein